MTSARDPYAILGVSRTATPVEIKRAYRLLAKELHPDLSSAPGTEERFKEVLAAYEILSDPRKRARYDAFRAGARPGGTAPGRADDISHPPTPRPAAPHAPGGKARNPWWRAPLRHPVLSLVSIGLVLSLFQHAGGGSSGGSPVAYAPAVAAPPSPSPPSPRPTPHQAITLPMTASDMVAFSDSDVWAVGDYELSPASEHWDGSTWTRVRVKGSGELASVSGTSSSDIWAVGGSSVGSSMTPPLIEHWDGVSWNRVAGAHIGYPTSRLNSVSAFSPSDAWAVGWAGREALAEHWDGSSWSLVPVPTRFKKEVFLGVSADAPDDVWAVGSAGSHALIAHRTQGTWAVDTLSLVPGSASLEAVHAFSPDDVWVAGTTFTKPTLSRSAMFRAFVARWDGRDWTLMLETKKGMPFGVKMVASSPSDIWVLVPDQGPLEHWDGVGWKVVHLPPDQHAFAFFKAFAGSHDHLWLADDGYWRWSGGRWRST